MDTLMIRSEHFLLKNRKLINLNKKIWKSESVKDEISKWTGRPCWLFSVPHNGSISITTKFRPRPVRVALCVSVYTAIRHLNNSGMLIGRTTWLRNNSAVSMPSVADLCTRCWRLLVEEAVTRTRLWVHLNNFNLNFIWRVFSCFFSFK